MASISSSVTSMGTMGDGSFAENGSVTSLTCVNAGWGLSVKKASNRFFQSGNVRIRAKDGVEPMAFMRLLALITWHRPHFLRLTTSPWPASPVMVIICASSATPTSAKNSGSPSCVNPSMVRLPMSDNSHCANRSV